MLHPLGKKYVSCITIGGRPILPPVMTEERVTEMQYYRELARSVETRLLERRNASLSNVTVISHEDIDVNDIPSSINSKDSLFTSDNGYSDENDPSERETPISVDGIESLNSKFENLVVCDDDVQSLNESVFESVNVEKITSGKYLGLVETTADNFLSNNDSGMETEVVSSGKDIANVPDERNPWAVWKDFADGDRNDEFFSPPAIIMEGIGGIEPDLLEVSGIIESPVKTDIDSSPSLASTDLGKYMDNSSEENSFRSACSNVSERFDLTENNASLERTESSSTCSTVKAGLEQTPETTGGGTKKSHISRSCNNSPTNSNCSPRSPSQKHVRRRSYTLECPSPALAAHIHLLTEQGLEFPNDMSGRRRMNFAEATGENSKPDGNSGVLSSGVKFVFTEGRVFEDSSKIESRSMDEMLSERKKYFERLQIHLQELHNEQMARLLKQQQEEQLMLQEKAFVLERRQAIETESKDDRSVIVEIKELKNPLKAARKLQYCDVDSKLQLKFELVSAFVKGYLTRRLLKTERVQGIIKTIQDTLEFAVNFHNETPVKTGCVTSVEANLHKRILHQLTSSCHEFHDVFFKLPMEERMAIISQDRQLLKEKAEKEKKAQNLLKRNLSSATLKALERKKVKLQSESSAKMVVNRHSPRSKSAVPWSLRSKRAKGSLDSFSRLTAPVVGTLRPRTTSPRYSDRTATRPVSETSRRNVRRSLSSVFIPGSYRATLSGGRTFRVNRTSPRQSLSSRSTNVTFSPKK